MKAKFVLLGCLAWISVSACAQLTIEDCYRRAQSNYPLIRQYGLLEKSKGYNLSNAGKGYLPQVTVAAKATYQSEVTEIPVSMPGLNIKGLTKDQYSATVEVAQTVWDGGDAKARRQAIETGNEADKQSVAVNLYAVNQRVNQLFFGILLFDEQIKQNAIYQQELQNHNDKISAYMRGGIANQADLDAVKVEQLKAEQTLSVFQHNRAAYLAMLSYLIGTQLPESTQLVKPEASETSLTADNRPELQLYTAQLQNLEAKKKQLDASLMPRVGVFLTGGYGRPGLNMLKRDFSAYYIGGIKLSWSIGGFYSRKNNLQLIEQQKNAVEVQRETFLFNNRLEATQQNTEIEKYRDQLHYDDEIIRLRTSVKTSSQNKVANGTLSGIDLMRDVNSEETARQDKILHEIQWLQAIYNLKFTTNR